MNTHRSSAPLFSDALPLLVSGRNEDGLRAQAGRWAAWIQEQPHVSWTELRRAAALRPHLTVRAAIQAPNIATALAALKALAAGQAHPAVSINHARVSTGLVFVFPGIGGQWSGMGRQLLAEVPVFAETIAQCDAALRPHLGWSVERTLRGEPDETLSEALSIDRLDVMQCLNFSMGIGLAAVYQDLGIVPDAIVGHSLGEMTAAVAAGAISLEDGARGIYVCARLIMESTHQGGMLFVKLPAAEVEAVIRPLAGLYIGTVDAPDATSVSGDIASLVLLEQELSARGVFHRRVKISGAPHTPHMEPLLPGLYESQRDTVRRHTPMPMVSSITGEQVEGTALDADYWCRNLCSQVRFDKAVHTLLSMGMSSFLEIGPHPLFTSSIASVGAAYGVTDISVLGCMRRNGGGAQSVFATLGALHNGGHAVPWSSIVGQARDKLPSLPSYVFPQGGHALPASPADDQSARAQEATPLAGKEELAALAMETRVARIEAIVREEMAVILGMSDAAALEASTQLGERGLDSLMFLDLKNRISRRVGLRLPQQFLYDHPTLELATRAIAERVAPVAAAPPPQQSRPQAKLAALLLREHNVHARVAMVLGPLRAQVSQALGRDEVDAHRLLQEMGIDDVLGAELCLRLQRETGLRVFPREIVEQGTLHELATHVAAVYAPYESPQASVPLGELDRRIVSPYYSWPLAEPEEISTQKLTFILSPPRSGSTLLRVMLAGHSELFSPQELYLAPFHTMRAYDDYLRGTVLNMGLVGAIAEVISRTGSWNLYRQWVREEKPTAEIYTFFRERIGERILVDKSPLFFPPLAVLRRLARTYPNARFIHLIRHPVSCIGSYVQERFQGIFKETAAIDPYDSAEWCWTRVHEGIAAFASEIAASRMTQVYFEDLVEDPERVMRRLCPALGLYFEPAVLQPYSGHRMVAGGFQVGDPNFTRHKKIVADKSEDWRNVTLPRSLQEPTMAVARQLGYDVQALRDRAAQSRTPVATTSPGGAMGGIGMEQDIHLPAEIVPPNVYTPSAVAPRSVLLTGATGFLGAFLLDELMRQTDATVYCLVRAKDAEDGLARLRDNLGGYQLWKDEFAERIVPVIGDMGLANMGISEEARTDLASRIDAIYHCAARVSWLLPYSHLRDTNVGGLVQILRLACAGRTLPVHYVSSLGTAFMRPFEYHEMVEWVTRTSGLGTESILELPLGYLESKWVNMHIVAKARERGIPISLYAPGLIGGHSVSGADSLSESQFLHALIKGSAQLGGFPDAEGWRFIPVDQTAKRIIGCSLRPESHNMDLYLDSTTLIDPNTMVDVLRSYGYDVKLVPFAIWRQRVLDLADTHDTANALFGFTDVIYSFTPLRFMGQKLQMRWFLQNHGAQPVIQELVGEQAFVNRDLLERLVGYYVRVGAMPEPTRPMQSLSNSQA